MPALIAAERDRCAPASIDQVTMALTQTLSLVGGTMSQADRTAFLVAATIELQAIPSDLAIEGLEKARRSCRFAAEIIPAVFAYVEDLPARRRARVAALITLADAVGVPVQ